MRRKWKLDRRRNPTEGSSVQWSTKLATWTCNDAISLAPQIHACHTEIPHTGTLFTAKSSTQIGKIENSTTRCIAIWMRSWFHATRNFHPAHSPKCPRKFIMDSKAISFAGQAKLHTSKKVPSLMLALVRWSQACLQTQHGSAQDGQGKGYGPAPRGWACWFQSWEGWLARKESSADPPQACGRRWHEGLTVITDCWCTSNDQDWIHWGKQRPCASQGGTRRCRVASSPWTRPPRLSYGLQIFEDLNWKDIIYTKIQ